MKAVDDSEENMMKDFEQNFVAENKPSSVYRFEKERQTLESHEDEIAAEIAKNKIEENARKANFQFIKAL